MPEPCGPKPVRFFARTGESRGGWRRPMASTELSLKVRLWFFWSCGARAHRPLAPRAMCGGCWLGAVVSNANPRTGRLPGIERRGNIGAAHVAPTSRRRRRAASGAASGWWRLCARRLPPFCNCFLAARCRCRDVGGGSVLAPWVRGELLPGFRSRGFGSFGVRSRGFAA
jgi:hypothetical protein